MMLVTWPSDEVCELAGATGGLSNPLVSPVGGAPDQMSSSSMCQFNLHTTNTHMNSVRKRFFQTKTEGGGAAHGGGGGDGDDGGRRLLPGRR